MAFGTSTEVLREASTARLAVMPAALLPGERRVQAVPERQAELRQERRVIHTPVREEVPAVLLGHRPEPVVPHASMLRRPNSYDDVLHPACTGCETRTMLAVVKPSPLRLWGFLLTVVGGALIGVRLDRELGGGQRWGAAPRTPSPPRGSISGKGRSRVIIGALIIVGILGAAVRPARAAQRDRRRDRRLGVVAVRIASLGARRAGLGRSRRRDRASIELVRSSDSQADARSEVARALGTKASQVQAQISLWLTLSDRRPRDRRRVRRSGLGTAASALAGDAIDPDTLTASAAETSSDPEADGAPDV